MLLNSNNYGIWIGINASIAITEKLQMIFLRLARDKLISIIKQEDEDIIGVVYGYGEKFDAHCEVAFKNKTNDNLILLHSKDSFICDREKLIYTMYDGTSFNCTLAERIKISPNTDFPPVDNNLSVTQKLELWNMGTNYQYDTGEGIVYAGIDGRKYSICFNLSSNGNCIYCRVGQNGYCDKGRAMLSTICLRPNEVRMIDDNLNSIYEYKPMVDCFVADSCSFPSDYGWYWSLIESTDNYVTLNGCGGAIYKVYRIRGDRYEVLA